MKNFETLLLQPWLVEPDAFHALLSRAELVASTVNITADFLDELAKRLEPQVGLAEGGIAVVGMSGPMMRNPDIFDQILMGACCIEQLRGTVRALAADDKIKGIVLNIDSPGGTVNGTMELAADVLNACAAKPVYAFTGGLMCSAAYWVASQCDAIYASPSARIGSIGVIMQMLDVSKALADRGIKVEVFASGKFKGAGARGTSLTDEQRAHFTEMVAELANSFKQAVRSRGRDIPDSAMEGQTFTAAGAQAANLSTVAPDLADVLTRIRTMTLIS